MAIVLRHCADCHQTGRIPPLLTGLADLQLWISNPWESSPLRHLLTRNDAQRMPPPPRPPLGAAELEVLRRSLTSGLDADQR